jgi:pimeloyl-ACP methyl ester carboxylesterase
MTAPTTLDGTVLCGRNGNRLVALMRGQGPAVLFLHGGLGSASGWIGVADLLAGDCRSVLLDSRAHGHSDWGPGLDIEDEAHDIVSVIDAVGPIRALVGHSYGALVALRAAALAGPERVPTLVVYEPPLTLDGPLVDEATLSRIDDDVAAGHFEAALLEHLGTVGGGLKPEEIEVLRTDPMLRAVYADLVIQAPAIGPGLRQANASNDIAAYRAIRSVTHLLLGTESPEHPFRRAVTALRDELPSASIHELAGQGHLATIQAPQLVADAVRSAIRS